MAARGAGHRDGSDAVFRAGVSDLVGVSAVSLDSTTADRLWTVGFALHDACDGSVRDTFVTEIVDFSDECVVELLRSTDLEALLFASFGSSDSLLSTEVGVHAVDDGDEADERATHSSRRIEVFVYRDELGFRFDDIFDVLQDREWITAKA